MTATVDRPVHDAPSGGKVPLVEMKSVSKSYGNITALKDISLRVHAGARLMLDNIPHVKAFWIATGVEVAQTALWFGVDDLDGTVQEEKIYHMAGASTPEAMTPREIERLIRAAGREPVQRDTLYNVVARTA